MTGWETLVSSLGLSFAAGVNLYATVLVVGLAQRFGLVENLPGPLEGLANPWVLGAAGVLYTLEFLVDKVPFIATVWDGFHTVIRPLGGALIALGAAHDLNPLGQAAAVLMGGSLALGTHSTKAGFRMLANTAPEPVTHSAISVAEDVGVFGLAALAITFPWAALAVIAVLTAGMVYLAPTIWRTLRFLLSCSWGVVSAAVGIHPQPESTAPLWLRKELDKTEGGGRDAKIYRAFARSNAGGPRYGGGYLVLTNGTAFFGREGLFRNAFRGLGPIEALTVESGVVCDTVVANGAGGNDEMRVCLAKHWSGSFRTAYAPTAAESS